MIIRYILFIKPVGYPGITKEVEFFDSRKSLQSFIAHHQLRYPFRFLYRIDSYEC